MMYSVDGLVCLSAHLLVELYLNTQMQSLTVTSVPRTGPGSPIEQTDEQTQATKDYVQIVCKVSPKKDKSLHTQLRKMEQWS